MWLFQPELSEVFDDDVEGQEGAGEAVTSAVSPRSPLSPDRREYLSLAAVPRHSRPSLDLQVPRGATSASCGLCSTGGGVHASLHWARLLQLIQTNRDLVLGSDLTFSCLFDLWLEPGWMIFSAKLLLFSFSPADLVSSLDVC